MRFIEQGLTLLAVLGCIGVAQGQERVIRQGPGQPTGPAVQLAELRQPIVELPIALAGAQILVDDVYVNGEGPFRFILDTGAMGGGRVDVSLVEKLELETMGQVTGSDGSTRPGRSMSMHRLETLDFGGLHYEGVRVLSRDYNQAGASVHGHIDGILGYALFEDYLLTIEYGKRTIRVERGDLPEPNGADVVEMFGQGVPSVDIVLGGQAHRAMLDTGAMADIVVPQSVADSLELAGEPVAIGQARTVSGSFPISRATLAGDLQIGQQVLSQPALTITPSARTGVLLGGRALQRFIVTYDQKNGRARFEQANSPVPEAAPQWSRLGREPIKVPMEFVMGLPTIEAKINGQGPFRFIFDTGAGTVVLDESLAKELGIEPTGTTRIGDPAAPDAVEAKTYTVDQITIGEAQFGEVNAVSWGGGMHRARGIIGLPVLYEAIVSIDYPNKQLTIWRGALGPNDGSIPYRLDQGWIITIDVDVAGEKIVGHIDSGNMSNVMLPLALAERLPLKSPPRLVGQARTISGSFDIHSATLDGTLSFAGQTFENPQLNFNDHLLNAANLGRTALEPFVLTIDQINQRLRFDRPDTNQGPQRRAAVPSPERPKYGVMFNGLGSGPLTVSGTQPDSIAERAGLQAGDVIIRLNGKDADNLSQDELATLFRSSPVKLVIQRDAKEVQIEMRFPENSPSVLQSRSGVSAENSAPPRLPACGVPVGGGN
ncbi:MAG: aspartyl protease family protein [Phycisphaerales bacterium]